MKHLLIESYAMTERKTGINPSHPGDSIKRLLVDDRSFNFYIDSLSEGLSAVDKASFKILAENSRVSILENSMYGTNPYESMVLPILRVFYPKLIAKELVTVSPMDKPEVFRPFMKFSFTKANSATYYNAPVTSVDISSGAAIGTPISAAISVPSKDYDVLAVLGLTSAKSHIERNFTITSANDGTAWSAITVLPDPDGRFSAAVTCTDGNVDVITGFVNYELGTVSIANTSSKISSVRYTCTCSLEENQINPKAKMSMDKIRLYAKDREISADWSIQFAQDMKALYDVNVQTELVAAFGQQIATDIDREIITTLISGNTNLNSADHAATFSTSVPSGYAWGPKMWHENIIPVLNKLSNVVYTDTNIDAANVIACHPLDSAILEDLNGFEYTGMGSNGGDLGYKSATVSGGKWKILTSTVVPQGKMVMVYKPAEEIKATYIFAPYVPAVMSPFPLGAKPSMTMLSRNAQAFVRPAGVSVCTLS